MLSSVCLQDRFNYFKRKEKMRISVQQSRLPEPVAPNNWKQETDLDHSVFFEIPSIRKKKRGDFSQLLFLRVLMGQSPWIHSLFRVNRPRQTNRRCDHVTRPHITQANVHKRLWITELLASYENLYRVYPYGLAILSTTDLKSDELVN